MKSPKKMKNEDAQDALFFEKLTDLAEKRGFRGTIKGEPPLPAAGSLTLEEIARIKVMMGSLDITALALKIGAHPTEELLKLNAALKAAHGPAEYKEMNGLLRKYKAAADQIDHYEPEKKVSKKPRSTKN